MKRSPALLLLALLVLSGCQRGCLSTWLNDHGFGGELPKPPSMAEAKEAPCPDGLARCRAGAVSVSRAYTPPERCSPEGCRCPWEQVAVCPRGCAAEGFEIEMPRESAAKQLCAPEPGAIFARAPGALPEHLTPRGAAPDQDASADESDRRSDESVVEAFCEVERYHCARGVVHRCDSGQARPVAVCSAGCVQGEGLIVEEIPVEAATAVLCAR